MVVGQDLEQNPMVEHMYNPSDLRGKDCLERTAYLELKVGYPSIK